MPFAAGDDLVLLLRLVVATTLAAAAGWDREHAGKAAGLRTHMLVGLAAALYTGIGAVALGQAQSDNLRGDPVRIVQAVALGVGFLGGGSITVLKSNGHVVGLTTAASIWATAAIGIATGMGHYLLAVGATLLQILILRTFERFEH
jgi:putative Mg2+ transporter-C (MgtC) family protein